ncbi:MAG TPA: hypothetical protein VGD13_17450, partial [Xanthobacteraceae bacterium]
MSPSGAKSAGAGCGVWPGRRTLIAAMTALLLLPIEAGNAGWLQDMFKGSSSQGKSPKQHTAPKQATAPKQPASPKRATLAKPAATP